MYNVCYNIYFLIVYNLSKSNNYYKIYNKNIRD